MKKENKFTVDFIGVGATRSGTTWVSRCLEEHPDICFSKEKETHFFSIHLPKGKDLNFYKNYFTDCAPNKIKGEFSPHYMLSDEALRSISEYFPDVKILVILRNPTERAFSHYLYRKKKLGSPSNFSSAIDTDEVQIVTTGFYSKHLNRIFSYFKKENILVLVHDDAKNNPKEFVRSIYNFLGVDDTFMSPSLLNEINRTSQIKYYVPQFQWILNRMRYKLRESRMHTFIVTFLKILGIHKMAQILYESNRKGGNSGYEEVIDSKNKKRLQEIYKIDIEKVEKMIGRNLDFWK